MIRLSRTCRHLQNLIVSSDQLWKRFYAWTCLDINLEEGASYCKQVHQSAHSLCLHCFFVSASCTNPRLPTVLQNRHGWILLLPRSLVLGHHRCKHPRRPRSSRGIFAEHRVQTREGTPAKALCSAGCCQSTMFLWRWTTASVGCRSSHTSHSKTIFPLFFSFVSVSSSYDESAGIVYRALEICAWNTFPGGCWF